MTVFSVRRRDVVVVAQPPDRTHRDGFLSDIEMTEPTDLAQRVGLTGFLFEAPNQQHSVQQLSVKIRERRIESCVGLQLRHAVFRAELYRCRPLRLLPGVVRGSHQRAGLDMAESHGDPRLS